MNWYKVTLHKTADRYALKVDPEPLRQLIMQIGGQVSATSLARGSLGRPGAFGGSKSSIFTARAS